MSTKVLLVTACLLLAGAAGAFGQVPQDSLDLGEADTITVEFPVIPDATTNQLQLQMTLYFWNDVQSLGTAGLGFFWDNPNMTLDSAIVADTAAIFFNFITVVYYKNNIDSSNATQWFQFSGARSAGPGLEPSLTRKTIANYYWTLDSWSVNDSIVIDTLAFSGGTVMNFVDVSNNVYVPYWTGRNLIRDTAYEGPSNLLLSEDTLFFDYTIGGPTPGSQTFDIDSDNEALAFTLSEDASWLLRSPSSGLTPETIDVSVVTVGLGAGTYFDSIMVSSAGADNSPQYVYVQLDVSEPPPTIGVSQTVFNFNAIVDGANPPPDTLVVFNTGSSTLDWTVTNSQSWLTLNPGSGTDSGEVVLDVDITGLGFGDYFDTVVVSDPEATNDPVLVEVKLSILSSLPLIDVDSVYNYVFALSELPIATRDIEVRNGGGGVLNFWIEEKQGTTASSPEIIDFDPDTSVADDFITISWQGISIPDGREKSDTLLVYSDDAANSPQEVVINSRWVTNPSVIALSTDTVVIDVYECDQGFGNPLPSTTFDVTNAGGDNPMLIELDYQSALFQIIELDSIAPATYTVTALDDDLPVGSYFDTVVVSTQWALNTPLELIVQYNIIPGDQTPQIVVPRTDFEFPYRDGTGPQADSGITIYNAFGGCMPWSIVEDVDWLIPSDTTGDVVGDVDFIIIPQGLGVGEYFDTLTVVAAGASNSPYEIEVRLVLWSLIGDWNWDGQITITDLTIMVNYLFITPGDPPPQPYDFIGNTDCDSEDQITIADLTALVDFLFISLQPICDNPVK
ncbi:hypothetical protein GF377_08170 [candidate division GN15 bacterium]|nr:hypothetical protein [candidate division GN15 bacterium]